MRGFIARKQLAITATAVLLLVGSVSIAQPDRTKRDRPIVDQQPAVDPTAKVWEPPTDTAASLDGGVTVNPVLLQPIRDNTLGLESDDRHAYFYILWLCREIGTEAIAQFAKAFREERRAADPRYSQRPAHEFPVFVDVFRHPEAYRGRPVTLHGYFRRLVKFEPGENDLGVRHVYEGWVYTEDSQNNPAVVIFTKKPEGLQIGGDITEEVQFSGYFLKMYGYEAQDTTRKAPLFIAGEVQWFPHRAANATFAMSPWMYVLTGLVVVLAVWGLWRLNACHTRRALPAVLSVSGRDGIDRFAATKNGNQASAEHQH
jgi:hypothetical protein